MEYPLFQLSDCRGLVFVVREVPDVHVDMLAYPRVVDASMDRLIVDPRRVPGVHEDMLL